MTTNKFQSFLISFARIVIPAAFLLLASVPDAFSAAQLRLSDGTVAGTITITDQTPGDPDPTLGVVKYLIPLGSNWIVDTTIADSKPDIGGALHPSLDLNTLNISSKTGGVLTIDFSDTGFLADGDVTASIGGNTAGNVTFDTWAGSANTIFEKSIPLTIQGPFTGNFSGNQSAVVFTSFPYSLTMETVITHVNKGTSRIQTGFDAQLVVLPRAAIGDRVWIDSNANGIQDSGEAGEDGVTVQLYRSSDNSLVGTTTTHDNGLYSFTELVPDSYYVQFSLPAGFVFSPQDQGSSDLVDSDADIVTGKTIPTTLVSGENDTTWDAGLIPLSSLSGFVYFDINNDGLFAGLDTPIPNATVTLTGSNDLGPIPPVAALTDITGAYSFPGLRPGTYTITETQPATFKDGIDTQGTPGTGITGNDVFTDISLAAGVNGITNNFGELWPASLSGFVYVDANNDGLYDTATESPIPNVTITLTGTDVLNRPVLLVTDTDLNGYYEFIELSPGTYTITETQPVAYLDGKDTQGTPGTGNTTVNDAFTDIILTAGVDGITNNFGELTISCPVGIVAVECGDSLDPSVNARLSFTGFPVLNDCGNITAHFQDVETPGTTCSIDHIVKTIIRTWTVTDLCGNSSICIQKIIVTDTTAPVITCPVSTVLDCTADTSVDANGSATATDTCDRAPTISHTDVTTPGKCAGSYVIYRTWRATDACGNYSECVQTITVQDTTAPAISGVGPRMTNDCSAPLVFSAPVPSDICSGIQSFATNDVTTLGNCAGNYSVTRTWTAVDNCGNTSTATQTIVVQDTTAPTISGVGPRMTNDCSAPLVFSAPVPSDICSGIQSFATNDVTTLGNCAGNYSVTRTWTAVDNCGNTSTATQTIVVQDTTAPTISGVGPRRTNDCSAPLVFSAPVPSDICSGIQSFATNDVTTLGNCAGNYSVTRTWTAVDNCGNTSTATQTIVVQDTTAPTISGVGPRRTNDCSAPLVFSAPVPSDICSGIQSFATNDVTTLGNCAGNYSVTRTWTAVDNCGNTSTATQTIVVQDTTAPTISGVSPDKTIECPATPVFCSPSAHDTCGTATLTFADVTTLGCGNTKIVKRTWTATDACGNHSSASQTITVIDTTAPTISGVSPDKTIECPATPVFCSPSAHDTCGTATLTFADVTTPGCGSTKIVKRTWTATDACGNHSSASQTITVVDTTPPVINCPPGKQLTCGSPTDPGSTGTATATDNCSGAVTITYSDTPGVNSSGDTVITRTWKATDACGNSATCAQTITVSGQSCQPGTFDFSGNGLVSKDSPNTRMFTTANGVNVKVTGFSRTRDSSGTWEKAYVGSYSGGLGVTDTSENGSAPNHTLDNVGRYNFLLFEFDQVVAPTSAFLGYVSGDSDMSILIGTFNNPYVNHLNLNDTVVGQFGYAEDNDTDDSGTRNADFNVGRVSGNAMIIAASLSDTSPDDYFKVQTLTVCKQVCAPPPPPMNVCVHKATVGPSCSPSPSNPLNHAMWLPGIGTDFDFTPNPGSFVTYPDGTAKLTGTLRSQSTASKGFTVIVNLSGYKATTPAGGSPKKELQACAYKENGGPIDTSTWIYYTTFTATLTGLDTYQGVVINLTQTGPAFQIGFGANGKNFNFGASSWFKWTVTHQPTGCAAFTVNGQGDFNLDFYNCAQFGTYTQGGWGAAANGNNPGALLAANFDAVYPNDVVIGGTKTLKFTTASAIKAFLPAGGSANKLTSSHTDPTSSEAGVFAGQVLALQLNVDFSIKGILAPGLANLKVAAGNKLVGQTVTQVLAAVNKALGGGSLPSGCTISQLNDLLSDINGDFDGGTVNNGILVP